MRATVFEFRFRWIFILAIVLLGFWSPWINELGIGRRTPLLEWMAGRLEVLSFAQATAAVIVLATLIAALGMVLRVWGAAYLDPVVVSNAEMKAGRTDAVIAAGPFRYVRNPLYVGSWCMIAAISFAMPATGALVAMALLTFFLARLILGEEAFLAGKLGEPYQVYQSAVPRLLPLLRSKLPRPGRSKDERSPQWLHAVLTELNSIGIFLIMAVLSWRYDNRLMVEAILICFFVSLAVRGLLARPIPTAITLVCFGLLMEAGKMHWNRAAIISFGVWLVLRAALATPQKAIAEK